MNNHKICQPCRSYSLNVYMEGDSHSGSQDEHRRFLAEENEGEGEQEKNGYDCEDNAGYLNVNQVRNQ